MIRSNLCDFSDAYIYVKRTIQATKAQGTAANNRNKGVALKIVPHLLIAQIE